MMQKTNENENKSTTKYQEKKKQEQAKKNVLTAIIIIIAVLFFVYANDVRGTNKKTADTIQGIHNELNELRKDVKSQFDATGQKLLEQDKKIEGIKQSKANQKQLQSLVKTSPQRSYGSGNCETYRPLVSQYSWNVDVALAVMKAESGCNPQAANWGDQHKGCTGSFGLFQIACFDGQVYDPAQNVAIAYRKYQARGWQPWSVCNTGKVRCI